MVSQIKTIECMGCHPNQQENPFSKALYLGLGKFRDFDSDHSYGLPICFCGGIGNLLEDELFKINTDKILKLRHEYCPINDNQRFPDQEHIKIGEELLKIIKTHYELYQPIAVKGCFAEEISNLLILHTPLEILTEFFQPGIETNPF